MSGMDKAKLLQHEQKLLQAFVARKSMGQAQAEAVLMAIGAALKDNGLCYDITYDDDDTATEVLRSKIRTDAEERAAVGATAEELAAAGQEARPPLRVGQAVTARFADDDEQFYGGRVTAVKWRGHEEWTTEADHGTLSEAGLDRPRRPRGKIEGLAEGITVNEAQ